MKSSFLLHFLENILREFHVSLTLIGGMMDLVRKDPQQWLEEGTDMVCQSNDNLLALLKQVLELQKLNASDDPSSSHSEDEYLVDIQSLLDIQHQLQENYLFLKKENPDLSDAPSHTLEDPFLKEVRSLFEPRINDPEFSLNVLCETLNLSRSQFGRKVKAVASRTPAKYIRYLRIRKARELLRSSNLPIKEVAYAVGFTDPAYFTKAYFKEYGMLPSQMRK